ncbi:MarR family transcriptional regulator [Kitasatospora sp. NPDC093558]|uniref:MarR family winged helix-turn-helix transcriptional regulator n=1 Tax=Kitasatospora sp. NPDC093558 TaxID=3155201 RepID=UPI0034414271
MTSDSAPPSVPEASATPGAPADPGASALLALQRATHATLQLLAGELAGLGLTASEINALANLADGRSRTASELGAAVGTRPTTLTGVLDRLEQRGHITRGTRAGDRRSVLVELTASGRQTAETIRRTVTGLERRALRDLSPAQVDGFHAVLLALTKASA